MEAISVVQAMKAIKDERCSQCRRQAKGLVYRDQTAIYYCKRCLHKYMEQKENPVEKAATG